MEYLPSYTDFLYLAHHGIQGQKWGVRRYQNEDGSLTPAGKKRQARSDYRAARSKAADIYNKKNAEDDIKLYADMRRGKLSYTEADRRAANKETLRYQQYKAKQLSAKSKMSKELADNSKSIVRDFHNMRAGMQENASKRYGKLAKDTKSMIAQTNKVHDSLSRGERMAAYLLSGSTDALNKYYMDRRTKSAARAMGAQMANNALEFATDVYISDLINRRAQNENTND